MLPSTDLKASAPRTIAFAVLHSPAHPCRYRRFACPLTRADARLAEKRGWLLLRSRGLSPPAFCQFAWHTRSPVVPARVRVGQDLILRRHRPGQLPGAVRLGSGTTPGRTACAGAASARIPLRVSRVASVRPGARPSAMSATEPWYPGDEPPPARHRQHHGAGTPCAGHSGRCRRARLEGTRSAGQRVTPASAARQRGARLVG